MLGTLLGGGCMVVMESDLSSKVWLSFKTLSTLHSSSLAFLFPVKSRRPRLRRTRHLLSRLFVALITTLTPRRPLSGDRPAA